MQLQAQIGDAMGPVAKGEAHIQIVFGEAGYQMTDEPAKLLRGDQTFLMGKLGVVEFLQGLIQPM